MSHIQPRFVESIPAVLEPGVLYVSERFRTASHLCACGCGERVVTPLSPAHWRLERSGETVTLHPSIGNWDYACRSHYWIRSSKIVWSPQLSEERIRRIKALDLQDQQAWTAEKNKVKRKVWPRLRGALRVWQQWIRTRLR